jgi:hypothetical protein
MARRAGLRTGTGLLVLALAVTACDDTTEVVTYYDPSETLWQLEEILQPVESADDLLLGLDLAAATLEYYGPGALTGAVSLRPDRGQRALRTLRRESQGVLGALPRTRARADGRGAGQPATRTPGASTAAPFTLPGFMIGETMVWDDVDGYVVSGWGGAPAHGVRFLLYRMDPESGYPVSETAEVGYLDITDEDGGVTEGVRVRAVRETGPARVIADYTVRLDGSGSYDEGEMELVAWGSFGDGGLVEFDMLQELSWSYSLDRDELLMDYDFRRAGRSVELEGWATSRFEAPEWAEFDFRLWFLGGVDRVEIDASIRPNGALRGGILLDGYEVVRLYGTDGAPRFELPDGGPLHWRDEETLFDVWTGIADLIWYADWLLVPGDVLIAEG